MKYWYTRELKNTSFEEVLDDVAICLAEQWFGVLTKIDMQSAMKNKLNKDIDKYIILGACNPTLAYEALLEDYEIWLILPCNLVVYEKNKKIFISTIIPSVWMSFIENIKIKNIAEIAEVKLKKVIDSV